MKINIAIVGILALHLFSSCGVVKTAPQVTTRDSVVVVRRDSLVFRDSLVLVELPHERETVETMDDSSHLETSIAESDAYVRNGKLSHSIRNKDRHFGVSISIPTHYVTDKAHSTRSEVIRSVAEVEKRLTRWQQFFMGFGRAAFFLLIGAAVAFVVTRLWR